MSKQVLIRSEYKKVNICGTTVIFESGVASIPLSLYEKSDSKLFTLVEEKRDEAVDLKAMTTKELRAVAKVNNVSLSGTKNKDDMVSVLEGALYV